MVRRGVFIAMAVCALSVLAGIPSVVLAVGVTQIPAGSLTGTGLITFDDVAGGGSPGTNYDAIFESDGASFAERFVGQTLTPSGDFDTLSGVPSTPLALQIGAAGQNLNVFIHTTSNVLTGLGNKGFPSFDGIGEGSFAVLFDYDQSEFGFELVGGDGGSATVEFFKRDGSLIDTILLGGLSDQSYGFQRDGGLKDIAGISIWNTDGGGIGFDNLIHDVPGVPGDPNIVPEPMTMIAMFGGLVSLGGYLRRRRLTA